MSLNRLLLDKKALKDQVIGKWDAWCASGITKKGCIELEGDFLAYVQKFDFGIFTSKNTLDVIDEHRQTPYYAARFGGGLPGRPKPGRAPATPALDESRYLRQLMDAYADHKRTPIPDKEAMSAWPELTKHYDRQREVFYHAESLRTFARDNVPPGTFEDLQDEVHAGVITVESSPHADALTRVNAVTQAAAGLPLTANGLISVTKIQDKQGICHQLANEDRLQWVKP